MSITPGTDLFQCAQSVERGDPERFASVMAAPVPAREVLFPLYAFNIEVSRAPWVTSEPMIAQMRLQWWWDALEEIRAGEVVRRHEVVTPLAMLLDAADTAILQELVDARRLDVEPAPFDDEAALWTYLEQTSGGLVQVAARGLGGRCDAAARHFGRAAGLAAYLRAVPELVSRGRHPLPDGRPETLRRLARAGLKDLDTARQLADRRARPAFAAAPATRWVLNRVAADPGRVAAGELEPPEAVLRLRRVWTSLTGRW